MPKISASKLPPQFWMLPKDVQDDAITRLSQELGDKIEIEYPSQQQAAKNFSALQPKEDPLGSAPGGVMDTTMGPLARMLYDRLSNSMGKWGAAKGMANEAAKIPIGMATGLRTGGLPGALIGANAQLLMGTDPMDNPGRVPVDVALNAGIPGVDKLNVPARAVANAVTQGSGDAFANWINGKLGAPGQNSPAGAAIAGGVSTVLPAMLSSLAKTPAAVARKLGPAVQGAIGGSTLAPEAAEQAGKVVTQEIKNETDRLAAEKALPEIEGDVASAVIGRQSAQGALARETLKREQLVDLSRQKLSRLQPPAQTPVVQDLPSGIASLEPQGRQGNLVGIAKLRESLGYKPGDPEFARRIITAADRGEVVLQEYEGPRTAADMARLGGDVITDGEGRAYIGVQRPIPSGDPIPEATQGLLQDLRKRASAYRGQLVATAESWGEFQKTGDPGALKPQKRKWASSKLDDFLKARQDLQRVESYLKENGYSSEIAPKGSPATVIAAKPEPPTKGLAGAQDTLARAEINRDAAIAAKQAEVDTAQMAEDSARAKWDALVPRLRIGKEVATNLSPEAANTVAAIGKQGPQAYVDTLMNTPEGIRQLPTAMRQMDEAFGDQVGGEAKKLIRSRFAEKILDSTNVNETGADVNSLPFIKQALALKPDEINGIFGSKEAADSLKKFAAAVEASHRVPELPPTEEQPLVKWGAPAMKALLAAGIGGGAGYYGYGADPRTAAEIGVGMAVFMVAGPKMTRFYSLKADTLANYLSKNRSKWADVMLSLAEGEPRFESATVNHVLNGLKQHADLLYESPSGQ